MTDTPGTTTPTRPAPPAKDKTDLQPKAPTIKCKVTTSLNGAVPPAIVTAVRLDAERRGEEYASIIALGKTTVVYHGKTIGMRKVSIE